MKSRPTNEVLKDLMLLASTRGYMNILSEIASRDLFFDGKQAATINWGERLSYQELTLMIGLTLKSMPLSYDELDPKQVDEAINYTRTLLKELHWSYNDQFFQIMKDVTLADGGIEKVQSMTDEDKDNNFKKIFGSGASMVEATFYGDSGSYDFQYLEMAPRLYQYDIDWTDRVGLDFAKAKIIYEGIKMLSQVMHLGHTNPEIVGKFKEEATLRAIDEFTFPKDLLLEMANRVDKNTNVLEEDVDKFLALFSAKPEEQYTDFSGPGDLNILNIKPIIEISEGAYFIPVNFNLSEAIYQSPIYWMRQDDSYADVANKNRGNANEQITYEYFKQIFGDLAFKSVKVVKGKNTLTDIDVLGVIGSVAVVVQNKGKRMTKLALQGEEEQIRKDFKSAIQDAYNQGVESRKVLLGTEKYKFISEDGSEVILPQGIEEVYVLCVTSDVYPASMHQVSVYLEKDTNQPWPVPLSLFDLDMLALYLPDPYDFTFYLKQRVDLTEVVKSSGEMALLGYHLKHGLFKPAKTDLFMIDQDYAQLVDADYMYRKGRIKHQNKKHLLNSSWSNKTYNQLLGEMKANINDPKLTDMIFFLKTIPNDVMDGFTTVVKGARDRSRRDGQPHNCSMPIMDGDKPWAGVSYVIERTPDELQKRMAYIAQVNKYKSKSEKWLALGSLIAEPSLISAVVFGWEPWTQSDDMDKVAEFHEANSKGYSLSINDINQDQKRFKKDYRIHKKRNSKRSAKNIKKQSQRINRKK